MCNVIENTRFFPKVCIVMILFLSSYYAKSQQNVSGKTGLIYTPVARYVEDGTFVVAYSFVPQKYGFVKNSKNSGQILSVNFTILPRFDINVNLYQLLSNSQKHVKLGLGDRQIDFRYLILKEKKLQPSLAVIISTPTSISPTVLTHAIVATKNFNLTENIRLEASLGYGSPYHIYRKVSNLQNSSFLNDMVFEKKSKLKYHNEYLEGPFGGINLKVRSRLGLIAEYDSQHFNAGAYANLTKGWVIQAGILNFDRIIFSTSYSFSLLKPSKRLKKQQNEE